ncbi:hypothetical protein BH09VER1_BH09VER1_37510 [soil metagenome]
MKISIRSCGAAALLSLTAFVANSAQAQAVSQTVVTTPVTSMGTISEFSPSVLTVRSEGVTAPASYQYTKSTTYVDETGAPVSMATVKSGLPVTVYYTKDGDNMVASKVIVRKSVTTTTTDK